MTRPSRSGKTCNTVGWTCRAAASSGGAVQAVATRRLRRVQRLVDALHERLLGLHAVPLRDPDAHGLVGGGRPAKLVEHGRRVLDRAVAQHGHELLPAEPGEDIRAAQLTAPRACD